MTWLKKLLLTMVTVLILLFAGIWFLWSVSSMAYEYAGCVDGVDIYEGVWDCFVARCAPDENGTVVIPEFFNGKRIKSLGGYSGRGVSHIFWVDCDEETDVTVIVGRHVKEKNCDMTGVDRIVRN